MKRLMVLAMLVLSGCAAGPVEQGYVVVPCAISTAGQITVRKECGLLPVASINGAQPYPDPYAPAGE